jgi:hypothetical protein
MKKQKKDKKQKPAPQPQPPEPPEDHGPVETKEAAVEQES